jgi:hypothetical protein
MVFLRVLVLLFATTVMQFWQLRPKEPTEIRPGLRACEKIQRTVSIDRELFGLCGAGH